MIVVKCWVRSRICPRCCHTAALFFNLHSFCAEPYQDFPPSMEIARLCETERAIVQLSEMLTGFYFGLVQTEIQEVQYIAAQSSLHKKIDFMTFGVFYLHALLTFADKQTMITCVLTPRLMSRKGHETGTTFAEHLPRALCCRCTLWGNRTLNVQIQRIPSWVRRYCVSEAQHLEVVGLS